MADSKILQRILSKVSSIGMTQMDKVLMFYKLSVELERSKEPEIKDNDYHAYPIAFKDDYTMLIDFPCNKSFLKAFVDNRTVKWNKDLYIGINIVINNRSYQLLNIIIAYDDIKGINIDEELLPVKIVDFTVNQHQADLIDLPQAKLENLEASIKCNPTFQGIVDAVHNEIGYSATVLDALYLALSQKNPALSQVYSELSNKTLKKNIEDTPLATAFLSNSIIDNRVDTMNPDDVIQVTKLDESQRIAVAHALNDRVSVITGPPGTGKTQVILNILANALIKGKKVLVASKNNKAVDNVKDRFDLIDAAHYLLRFGTREHLRNKTIPEINRMLQKIETISNNSVEYNRLNDLYQNAVRKMKDAKTTLAHKSELVSQLALLELKINVQREELSSLALNHERKTNYIEQTFADVAEYKLIEIRVLDKCSSGMRVLHNTLQTKFSGFGKIWHNWFSKKKYSAEMLNLIESYPYFIKRNLKNLNLKSQVYQFKNGDELIVQCQQILKTFSRIQQFINELGFEAEAYNRKRLIAETELQKIQNKYDLCNKEIDDIINQESALKETIELSKNTISENSVDLLTAHIHHNISQVNSSQAITAYREYIPANIPWDEQGIVQFVNHTKNFLNVFKLNSVTNLSVKGVFPLTSELFDMVVIDEASQCDIASAIPLIVRAKQLVVIGDPMQLKHITSVNAEEEVEIKRHLDLAQCPYLKYAEESLWDYCQGLISQAKGVNKPVFLENHYRCHPDIIGYSNKMFYDGRLKLSNMAVENSKLKIEPKGIVMIEVKGKQVGENINVNELEVSKSIEIAVEAAQQYPNASIGIVTPFRHQAERLNIAIPQQFRDRIVADTVHKYQGDEKDIMIYSLVITDNSPETKIRWIDYSIPNLVNVAVTRARSTLYVVGNSSYIKAMSDKSLPLGYLIRYVEKHTK